MSWHDILDVGVLVFGAVTAYFSMRIKVEITELKVYVMENFVSQKEFETYRDTKRIVSIKGAR